MVFQDVRTFSSYFKVAQCRESLAELCQDPKHYALALRDIEFALTCPVDDENIVTCRKFREKLVQSEKRLVAQKPKSWCSLLIIYF